MGSTNPAAKPSRSSPTSSVSETHDFDPRYDRAQSVDGAKARYVSHDLAYDVHDLERDLDRLLWEGETDDPPVRRAGSFVECVETVDATNAEAACASLLSGGEVVRR